MGTNSTKARQALTFATVGTLGFLAWTYVVWFLLGWFATTGFFVPPFLPYAFALWLAAGYFVADGKLKFAFAVWMVLLAMLVVAAGVSLVTMLRQPAHLHPPLPIPLMAVLQGVITVIQGAGGAVALAVLRSRTKALA